MKLLALVLLFSALSSLTLTEVVESFTQSCPLFFELNPKVPEEHIILTIFDGPQYKLICQLWKNNYRFATVYDTERRIPVHSAYMFLKENSKKLNEWKIEPQLEDITDKKEMIDSPTDAETVRKITHQAVNGDYTAAYRKRGYERGHVFPRSFATDQDQVDSTYTLTNVAPQTSDSNGKWASEVETPMKKLIKNKCKLDENHQAYIVTGVVPGNQWIPREMEPEVVKGINVPGYFWSAFCSTDRTNGQTLIGKAYLAEQDPFDLQQLTIIDLNERLSELYDKTFNVFPGLDIKNIETDMKSINSFSHLFLYSFFSRLSEIIYLK